MSIVTPSKTNLVAAVALPDALSEDVYGRALDMVRLASKTYDWDDNAVVKIGMNLFSGIDDILAQDFRTPAYVKVRGGGNGIDWWGGNDFGLDYTIFENKDEKIVVLAFRGTEPLSVEDWIEDIKQAFGSGEQYKNAVNLAKSIHKKAKANGVSLIVTGHSLGGGLASAAALATGCQGIVFDAAGVSDDTIKELDLDVENQSKITNFNVRECFVSDWNKKMDDTTIGSNALGKVSTQKQYGKIFWLESISARAEFKLLPDWTRTVKRAESVLNHAWHVIAFQLDNKNFVDLNANVREHDAEENPRPTKMQKFSD